MQVKGARKRAFYFFHFCSTTPLSFRAEQDRSLANDPAKSRACPERLTEGKESNGNLHFVCHPRKLQVPPRVIGLTCQSNHLVGMTMYVWQKGTRRRMLLARL